MINIENNDIDFTQPTAQKLKFTVKDEYYNEYADEIMVDLVVLDKELINVEEIKDKNLSEIESLILEKKELKLEAERLAAIEEEKLEKEKNEKTNPKKNTNKDKQDNKPPVKNSAAPQFVGVGAVAKKYIGRTGISCDGLITMAMEDMGYASYMEIILSNDGLRGRSIDYLEYMKEIEVSSMAPGDILFSPGHAEIYVGNNQSLHGGYEIEQNVLVAPTSKGVTHAFRFDGTISTEDVIAQYRAEQEHELSMREDN